MKNVPEIIYENEGLVAVNKPPGLLSIKDRSDSAPSLKDMLQEKYGEIYTVHRLDRDTSGIIVFAKNDSTHKFLSRQFENRETEKKYTGIVQGTPAEREGTIDVPIMEHPTKKGTMVTSARGKDSVTSYTVEESFGLYSLVQFTILTGRTHQIRVHMKYLGHPVACDPLYGSEQPVLLSSFKKRFKLSRQEEEERPLLNRLGLHAQKLGLKDVSGEKQTFEAPLFKDMNALLQQLRKWKK